MTTLKGLEGKLGDPGDGGTVVIGRRTLWDALRVFSVRSLVFALILGAFAAAGGAAVSLRRPTLYSADASLLIDQPKLVQIATDQGPLQKLALLRFKYIGLATTPAIDGPAADSLGMSESHVAGAVTVTAPATSLLLITTAQESTSASAERVANAVAQSIANYADQEQQQINVVPSDRYRFVLVKQASSAVKIQPTKSRAVQSAVALGAVAMVFVYVLMQLVTAGVRSP